VLINGHLTDSDWKATGKWSLAYLNEKGDSEVVVEMRQSTVDSFGKGRTRKMLFSDFLKELESGNEMLYLSAQNAEVGQDGFPELLSPPLMALSDDICLKPALLGHLVPQQVNIWIGCSSKGAASGLHHDYHDNLYVLLKGTKHFSLFLPDAAPQMYTHGKIRHIHPNGRIVYDGQGDVRADGSDSVDVAEWTQRQSERTTADPDDHSSTDESDLEAILDRCDEERDDYEESVEISGSSSEDADRADGHTKKRHKPNPESHKSEDIGPLNFSQVDTGLELEALKAMFPDFPGLSSALQCQVHEGQMLYLPAGWFHNVTSTGEPGNRSGVHVAVNYWCHPPDNLGESAADAASEAFHKPYLSGYWPSMWETRCSSLRNSKQDNDA